MSISARSVLPIEVRTMTGLTLLCLLLCTFQSKAQESKISAQIATHSEVFNALPSIAPLAYSGEISDTRSELRQAVTSGSVFAPNREVIGKIMADRPEFLVLDIETGNQQWQLQLQKAKIFSDDFKLYTSSDRSQPYAYTPGVYYWGVIAGKQSLVALAVSNDEISGFIQAGDVKYTLGKLTDESRHILYRADELQVDPGVTCFVDDSYQIGNLDIDITDHRQLLTNCVRMYVEVDYDIYVNKGSVQATADYVNGAFSQVAILYANEDIELVVNELVVWNTSDPYNGPTTSNYLTQFRNNLNGVYNGDLAHLVGYGGGGGVAYLDVLCNGYYGVGYSGINSSYNQVPTYGWTVEVLTHEIGHNLGSPHTHACAWNGNNTAIDGCGPAAGYSEGCNGPIPASGTIMSYCHLISGVGINFLNGFGPQPGNVIRNRVSSSSCLSACGAPAENDAGITAISAPIPYPCAGTTAPIVTLQNFGVSTLTSVTIQYQVDNGSVSLYNWSGSLAQNQSTEVTLPVISYGTGGHDFTASTSNPNGQPDENLNNDESAVSFIYYVDWCTCNAATGNLSPNPLSHSGNGSSTATINLGTGSKRPDFVISNLDSRQNGPPNNRYTDVVTVTYVDGDGITRTYGTFNGAQQSTVNVYIFDMVSSVTVALSNGQNNQNSVSVDFGQVDYCAGSGGCPDEDQDGVCDADDLCPGFDDGLIGTACDDGDPCTENDLYTTDCICAGTAIPGCPGSGCPAEVTSQFTPNPLTHTGTGASGATVTIPAGNEDVTFTISDLGAKTNGNPNSRWIDHVVVSYDAGAGNVQYGIFDGDQVSSVDVVIPGPVNSVTVALSDGFDGDPGQEVLSVTFSDVTSCNPNGLIQEGSSNGQPTRVEVYPNPTSGDLFVKWNVAPANAQMRVYNALGVLVGTTTMSGVSVGRIDLRSMGIASSQLIFVSLEANGELVATRAVIVSE